MKSGGRPRNARSFYVSGGTSDGRPEPLESTPATAGPWGPDSQHGGPPAALAARELERLAPTGRVVGRLTLDLLGPVPVGPLEVSAEVLRPGRTVDLCAATVHDVTAGRDVLRATAWRFPADESGAPCRVVPPAHRPVDGEPHPRPAGWSGGYLDAVEWRWVKGAVTEPGPGVVWMRPLVGLVEGERMTPLQRLLACVDSASGVSAELDPAEWGFLNTELTVHVLREPVGEWLCLEAETTLGPGSVGLATSQVYDERGLVARSAQALLVSRRR